VERWKRTKFMRVCANYSGLAGDRRPRPCWRTQGGPQNSTECNATNAHLPDIERGAALCSLPMQPKTNGSCDSTMRQGVCGTDRRCYNVLGIVDVGVDACKTLEFMNATIDYGGAMRRYYQVDALALYSRYALLEIAIYNTQILSGVGKALPLRSMQLRDAQCAM
jgi:hypothetical protein